MAKRYGCPYQGSKNAIAEDVIAFLPKGERLVDLFGGGGAITHCALESRKYSIVLYNELDKLVFDYVRKAFTGGYKTEKRWISREDFNDLKNSDGYVRYCWSFGNDGRSYLYSSEIEPWKRALHFARVFDYTAFLSDFGITSDGSRQDVNKNKDEYKEKYIRWYLKEVLKSDADFDVLRKTVQTDLKLQKEELRSYLCDALQKSGLKQSDINKALNTQMASHWFVRSQWQFPTREQYAALSGLIPLKPYDEVYGYSYLLQSLQSLGSLQRLERLQSLQSLESLERLEYSNASYETYRHEAGDVVYCDIPYEGTRGYSAPFDHAAFYDWAASRGFPVFVSSYNIGDARFFPVWEKEKSVLFNQKGSDGKKMERIYVQAKYADEFRARKTQLDLFP